MIIGKLLYNRTKNIKICINAIIVIGYTKLK